MDGMTDYLQHPAELDKKMCRRILPRAALDCDAVRVIIYIKTSSWGEPQIDNILEFRSLSEFIKQFNKRRDDWANLPWPSSCKLEFLKKKE